MKTYKYTIERRMAISKGRLRRKELLGYLNSPATRKKMSVARKGVEPWNKGKTYLSPLTSDEQHWAWKGDKVGYNALHDWVRRKKGTPLKCEKCGTEKSKKFEWANISGKYKRVLTDWVRLCGSCHKKMDGIISNLGKHAKTSQ